ncbi:MAG: HAD-IIB family hydrolase [Erysipelotrichaceae bacterium]|nr:HAD-IIB family hydrolase [Erysipelotrichaceae bacterium]
MTKKYFFFDIDGTLIPEGYTTAKVPESVVKTLDELRAKGHFVAIATGRAEAMARKVREELGFENMVHDGGAGITINNEIISIDPLDHEAVNELIDQCKEHGFTWGLGPENMDYRLVPDERFFEETHDKYCPCKVVEGLDPRNYPQIIKAYVACHAGDEELLPALKKLPWARFQPTYIFVEPTSKSNGIRKVVDYFGGDYKDVVVFGDAMNDYDMFRDEWTSIAMGNACQELKDKADYVTADADKDGIYLACKHYGWVD